MTARIRSRRKGARSFVALAGVAVLALSGCTTMPGDTTPQAIRTFEAPAHDIEVPEPRPDGVLPSAFVNVCLLHPAHPTIVSTGC